MNEEMKQLAKRLSTMLSKMEGTKYQRLLISSMDIQLLTVEEHVINSDGIGNSIGKLFENKEESKCVNKD
jgi:hypothetical protein